MDIRRTFIESVQYLDARVQQAKQGGSALRIPNLRDWGRPDKRQLTMCLNRGVILP